MIASAIVGHFADRVAPSKNAPTLLISPMWASTLLHLGRISRMLPNYDAKAVAEVMGIEFQRPKEGKVKARSKLVSWPSAFLIAKAVESGLPRKVLRRVAERIAGEDKAKVSALEFDVVPKTTLQRREGRKLTLHESEQTEHVARLFVHARRAARHGSRSARVHDGPAPRTRWAHPGRRRKNRFGDIARRANSQRA